MKGNDEAAQIASAILSFRRYCSRALSPNIFGEPAWELLLEVFVADAAGAPMTGKTAAERNDASPNVMCHVGLGIFRPRACSSATVTAT